ncbi:alkaline phosphatase family protein [Microcella sp.]|uniref:alkaline phosphatase family protein n=1 Tax=Microcella sp. TaxID=1913979 RepID=UPI00299F725D|nr:alkaline phosphatase family protein [Microcella sp.]MDX2025235.1 alkaline phosphatase family protein [Microcella sp.]
MAPMLPAPRAETPSLADVLTGALGAILGESGRLALPPVRSAAVLMIDGLGMSALSQHSGHARRLLNALPSRGGSIESGFPTTTASALATLTTGLSAGEHGLVGYSVLDRARDRVVKQLSGWDDDMRPREWQPHNTVFERAAKHGVDAVIVGAERYRDTGFTEAVLRGARFEAYGSVAERIARGVALMRGSERRLVYVYVPEIDMAGHAEGIASALYTARLDELDSALRVLDAPLPADAGVLLTADHGMLDVPPHRRIVVDAGSGLWDGIRHVAGEPRCLHFALDDPAHAELVRDRWLDAEGSRSWVVTRGEAIAAGWFGTVRAGVESRIGDVLVAARAQVAYYDERTASAQSLSMVGQHGSFSADELRVPLARWGAFAH